MRIFLSYATEDKTCVEEIYRELSAAGFIPWMDERDILPGEQWELSLEKAIRNSDIFLACLSENSFSKRGWIQKEIRFALNAWSRMLPTDIFLIPVRLDACEIPDSLSKFQGVDLFGAGGWARLFASFAAVAERLKGENRQATVKQESAPAAVPNAQSATTAGALSMRAVDLACLEEGGPDCVLYWRDGAAFDFLNNEWRPMSPDLMPRHLSGYLFRKEVFLCLRGDHLLEGYDHQYVRKLLGVVRGMTGEASTYLVKDRNITVNTFEQAPISMWINEVFDGGVTDIVEIEMADRYDLRPLNIGWLRAALDISRHRRKAISPIDPKEKWGCYLPRAEYFLLWFLETFVIRPRHDTSDANAVIVLRNYQGLHRQFLTEILKSCTRGRIVVWLSTLPPAASLRSMCSEQGIKLVHCQGPFELRYLLLQLNLEVLDSP